MLLGGGEMLNEHWCIYCRSTCWCGGELTYRICHVTHYWEFTSNSDKHIGQKEKQQQKKKYKKWTGGRIPWKWYQLLLLLKDKRKIYTTNIAVFGHSILKNTTLVEDMPFTMFFSYTHQAFSLHFFMHPV